jgi:hypothetical protein
VTPDLDTSSLRKDLGDLGLYLLAFDRGLREII